MPVKQIAALTAAFALAAAAPAAADSIAYIKGGDVWLATPDGARQVQVTHSGGYTSVSQADDGTMAALAPREHIHRLSRDGRVLSDIATWASDGAEVSGPVNKFLGPFDPQISPDGKLIAFDWFNDTYSGGSTPGCQESNGCYTTTSRKGVGITYSNRLTGPGEFGILTGWAHTQWLSNDVILRSFPQANMADDTVFTRIGRGKGDDDLDRWFYDEAYGGGVVKDIELAPDRTAAVAVGGTSDQYLVVYRPLMDPFNAPDWKFSYFQTDNVPVVKDCYTYTDPVGGRFASPTIAPDSRQIAYAAGDGVWVTDLPDLSQSCDPRPSRNALVIKGGSSPDWGPAGVPTKTHGTPGSAARLTVRRRTLRRALQRGLRVTLSGVPDGTQVSARSGRSLVATGVARRGAAALRFTKAAKRRLARSRSVRLVVKAGAATATVTLKR